MSLFKCSKCGGTKEVEDISRVTFCMHCGAKQEFVSAQHDVTKTPQGVSLSVLLERGFISLEGDEWEKADGFFEQVLNTDAKCAKAYLGKLLAELHIKNPDELRNSKRTFTNSNNYKNALRFGDSETAQLLSDANFEVVYNVALSIKKNAANMEDGSKYKKAADLFESITTYKDSEILAKECREAAADNEKDDADFIILLVVMIVVVVIGITLLGVLASQ